MSRESEPKRMRSGAIPGLISNAANGDSVHRCVARLDELMDSLTVSVDVLDNRLSCVSRDSEPLEASPTPGSDCILAGQLAAQIARGEALRARLSDILDRLEV